MRISHRQPRPHQASKFGTDESSDRQAGAKAMPDAATMTVRLSQELKGKLERLAASTKRPKSYLAAEAIAEYVDANAWQVEEIRKAVDKAAAGGPFVSNGDATRYLDTLSRGENPDPPTTLRVR